MFTKEDTTKYMSQNAVVESSSDDSVSTDEEVDMKDNCQKMMEMIKLKENMFKMFELDSRVGLNGSKCLESFPCLMEESN